MATKKLGDDFDEGFLETYKEWIEKNALLKYRVSEAALLLIRHVPRELRDRAIQGDWKAVERYFSEADAAWMFAQGLKMLSRVGVQVEPKPLVSALSSGGKGR